MRAGMLGRQVSVAVVVGVLLVASAGADVAPRTGPDGSQYAGETSVGVPADALEESASVGDALQERLAKQARSPGSKRARARDRSAFADETRQEALGTLSDAFPDMVDAPPWRPLELGDGDRILGYTSSHTAMVHTKDDGTELVESELPMRARQDGHGLLKALSFDMLAGKTAFELENPLVPVVINKDLDQGIEFPDQAFSVRPTGAASTDPPMRVGDKVLYANRGCPFFCV